MRALPYAQYALRHNWTPAQVDDEVYAWLEPWLLPIENLIQEVADERSRRQAPAPG